jgi:MYXO-CTERM domain-containing protein
MMPMNVHFKKAVLVAGLTITTIAAPVTAQGTATDTGTTSVDDIDPQVTTVREEEDHDFPWGLLGLLGLAGLLGRKRNERDIHVDERHRTK